MIYLGVILWNNTSTAVRVCVWECFALVGKPVEFCLSEASAFVFQGLVLMQAAYSSVHYVAAATGRAPFHRSFRENWA